MIIEIINHKWKSNYEEANCSLICLGSKLYLGFNFISRDFSQSVRKPVKKN